MPEKGIKEEMGGWCKGLGLLESLKGTHNKIIITVRRLGSE